MTFEEWWLPKIAGATRETPHGDFWCEEAWSDDGLVHIARAAWNAALDEATKVVDDCGCHDNPAAIRALKAP